MAYGPTILTGDEAEEAKRLPPTPSDVRGNSGNPLMSGRVSDAHEHNSKLADGQFFTDVRKMLRSPAARVAANKRIQMMQAATFTVVSPPGASDEPGDFLREQFGLDEFAGAGRLAHTWRDFVGAAAMSTLAGCAIFELAWKTEDDRNWIAAFLPRDVDSVDAWVTDESEALCGIRQKPTWVGRTGHGGEFLPANNLLVLTHMGSPGNPEGNGDLRAPWSQWRDQQKLYNLAMAGAQRFAMGVPQVRIDVEKAKAMGFIGADATIIGDESPEARWYAAQAHQAEQWASLFVAGAKAFVVPPPYWEISFIGGADGYDPDKIIAQIEHLERVQLMAGDAQWMQLGSSGSGGSYALGQVHAEGGVISAESGLRVICDGVNGPHRPGGGIVGALMRYNFPSLKPREFPAVQFSGVRAPKWVEHIDKLPGLVGAGVFTPTNKTEEAMRDDVGLPPLTPAEERSVFDRSRTTPMSTVAGQVARGASTSRAPEDGPLVARRQSR